MIGISVSYVFDGGLTLKWRKTFRALIACGPSNLDASVLMNSLPYAFNACGILCLLFGVFTPRNAARGNDARSRVAVHHETVPNSTTHFHPAGTKVPRLRFF